MIAWATIPHSQLTCKREFYCSVKSCFHVCSFVLEGKENKVTMNINGMQGTCLWCQFRVNIRCHCTRATRTADQWGCSPGDLMSWHDQNSALLGLLCMQASLCWSSHQLTDSFVPLPLFFSLFSPFFLSLPLSFSLFSPGQLIQCQHPELTQSYQCTHYLKAALTWRFRQRIDQSKTLRSF